MDGKEFYSKCLQQATAIVRQVRADQSANETPCSEWNVRDVARHMLYELAWVPDMLAGRTVDEVGPAWDGDLIGEDFAGLPERWQTAVRAAEEAIAAAEPGADVHMSYADTTVDGYLREAGGDLLIHSWDLGRGIGVPVQFYMATARQLYEQTLPRLDDMQSSSLFAPPLEVPAHADLQTKLLALFGRAAAWQPAA